MGFEICYKFHPRDEEGNYKKDEIKELKKKLGDPFEDVPLEKLASVIMSQLARRDIWVFDVTIQELVKKEVSFKETKGGIVIKNKKFLCDGETSNLIVSDEVPQTNGALVPTQQPVFTNLAIPTKPSRPIKNVTLDPDVFNLDRVKKSGLAFTAEKRYPVYQEYPAKETGVMIYTMHDDHGREVSVKDIYFLNADQVLSKGFYDTVDRGGGPKLAYDNYQEAPMPDIRRK